MGSSLHNSVGIGYNFYYLFLFLLVLFIFEISPRNKLQPPTDTQSPHSDKKSTMATASFLTFATLLVLMTLSWSQPGMAAPTSDGKPEKAAGGVIGSGICGSDSCAVEETCVQINFYSYGCKTCQDDFGATKCGAWKDRGDCDRGDHQAIWTRMVCARSCGICTVVN